MPRYLDQERCMCGEITNKMEMEMRTEEEEQEGFWGYIILIVIFLIFAIPAFATTPKKNPEVVVDVEQDQHQRQEQDQQQDQSQSQVTDLSQANAQSVTFTSPDDITVRNTPSIAPPSVYPTVTCYTGVSGGISVAGFGGSLGKGKIDPACVMREEIRLASGLGMMTQARKLFCNRPHIIEAFGSVEACLDDGFSVKRVPDSWTTEEADERCERKEEACKAFK